MDNGECCGGRWGGINLNGDFVVEPKFEILSFFYGEIAAFAIDTKIENTSSGYRCFGGKWGLLDRKGKVLIPAKYVHINLLSENLIAANLGGCRDYSLLTDGGNWALLNKYGTLLTNFKYTYIYAFHEGRAIFNINGIRESIEIYSVDSGEIIGDEWGVLNEDGQEIGIPVPANSIKEYGDALKEKQVNLIYQKYLRWLEDSPNEFNFWIGDENFDDNLKINPFYLLSWDEWIENRIKEDKFIENNDSMIPLAYKLIDKDAYALAFKNFIEEERLFLIRRCIPIVNQYSFIMDEKMNPKPESDQNIRDLLNLKLTRAEIRKLMREDNRYIKDDFSFCSEFFNQEIEMLIRIIKWVKKDIMKKLRYGL